MDRAPFAPLRLSRSSAGTVAWVGAWGEAAYALSCIIGAFDLRCGDFHAVGNIFRNRRSLVEFLGQGFTRAVGCFTAHGKGLTRAEGARLEYRR